jgi:hypothetical protein
MVILVEKNLEILNYNQAWDFEMMYYKFSFVTDKYHFLSSW